MNAPHFDTEHATIWHGDCIAVMRGLPDASVDAVCTDPPYALEFMGKGWDTYPPLEFEAWCAEWATEALRLLKPGGHLLAFGGTRTFHRLAAGIEDAGFEIRDSIAWLYGSGFPKSLDVSKAIDKQLGAQGTYGEPKSAAHAGWVDRGRMRGADTEGHEGYQRPWMQDEEAVDRAARKYEAGTEQARDWQGWGTALKPAFEPVVVARKPLAGTVAANVLKHGTGALNIDGSRIPHDEKSAAWVQKWAGHEGHPGSNLYGDAIGTQFGGSSAGRWPANVILDESQAAALDEQAGAVGSNSGTPTRSDGTRNADGLFSPGAAGTNQRWETRGAGASRFFKVVAPNPPFMYTAKAGSAERPKVMREDGTEGRVLGKGLERVRQCNICGSKTIKPPATEPACGHNDWQYVAVEKRDDHVSHPTVKPLDLMRWLVRLVTPKGGTVLEPFAGSGTTVEAAVLEGFRCIAIEREADYVPLIMQRVSKPHAVGLDFGDWEDAS